MRNLPRHVLALALVAGCAEKSSEPHTADAGEDILAVDAGEDPRTPDASPDEPEGDGGQAPSVERNECETGEHACDLSPAACVELPNEQGGYACACPTGFEGEGKGESGCVASEGEADECALGSHDCHAEATCIDALNTQGRYSCQCPTGYEGDGHGEDGCRFTVPGTDEVNECDTGEHLCDVDPAACADLTNAEGGYRCECPAGYVGDGVGSDGCRAPAPDEVDECLTGENVCAPDACVELTAAEGGYTCECPNGYEGDGVGAQGCRDLDECSHDSRCSDTQICINTAGSFACASCRAGFVPGAGAERNTCVPAAPVGREAVLLTAGSDKNASYFGRALAYEAGTLVVGAPEPYHSQASEKPFRYGVAHVFREQNGTFVHAQTLEGMRTEQGSFTLDKFGWEVALKNGLLVVAAPDESPSAVYVYKASEQGYTLAQRIESPAGDAAGDFGYDLAFDGNTLAVSDPDEANGAVYVYTLQGGEFVFAQRIGGQHGEAEFGQTMALSADTLAVMQVSSESFWLADVLVYKHSAGSFAEVQKLTGARDLELAPEAIALHGDTMAASSQDGVQVFELDNGKFVPTVTLEDKGEGEFFPAWGDSLYLDDTMLLVGIGYNSNDEGTASPISKYARTASGFGAAERYVPRDDPAAFFNGATPLRAGARVIVGAPQAARPGQTTLRSGAVYLFE